jgi:hypothetical protein
MRSMRRYAVCSGPDGQRRILVRALPTYTVAERIAEQHGGQVIIDPRSIRR